MSPKRRVGIVGFGGLGQYLAQQILTNGDELGLELAFVWNRTKSAILIANINKALLLDELSEFTKYKADIIVEVAHPIITKQFGAKFLEHADFMIGSPTALGNAEIENSLREATEKSKFGVYIPSGALWGGQDIRRMAERETLKALTVTMRFHPKSLKLEDEEANAIRASALEKAVVIYEGPVRGVCAIAPNNVNTMAAAAIAACNLGFDQTIGCLIADPQMTDYHHIEIEVIGPTVEGNKTFQVHTTRLSPVASSGNVSSKATFYSFLSSLINAQQSGSGFHLC